MNELAYLLRDARRYSNDCTYGSYTPCGCGLIHMIYHPCRKHFDLLQEQVQGRIRNIVASGNHVERIESLGIDVVREKD